MSSAALHLSNRLIDLLPASGRDVLAPRLQPVRFESGDVLFEPGDDVVSVFFPANGTIASLVLTLRDGATAEAAMIGQEGALGGIISEGDKPAFARGVVQIEGSGLRISTDDLDWARSRSPELRDHFARYADCLLAQVLQSVACNAVHELDQRLARWLLTTHDRTGKRELRVTQSFISEMLGVQRTYATRVIGELQKSGAIMRGRGTVTIVDRGMLERRSCECYGYLRRHFERLLPGVYPVAEN